MAQSLQSPLVLDGEDGSDHKGGDAEHPGLTLRSGEEGDDEVPEVCEPALRLVSSLRDVVRRRRQPPPHLGQQGGEETQSWLNSLLLLQTTRCCYNLLLLTWGRNQVPSIGGRGARCLTREGARGCKVSSGGRGESHCRSCASGGHRCFRLLRVMLNLLLILLRFPLILLLVLLGWFLVLFKVLLGLLLVLLVLLRVGFLLVHRLLLVLLLLHPVGSRSGAVGCLCLLVGGLHTLSCLNPSP